MRQTRKLEEIRIDLNADNNKEWKKILLEKLQTAHLFEVHCWSEEIGETEEILQYGKIKKAEWQFGKIIQGSVTREFIDFILSQPKPKEDQIYNKMTPFFSIFLDNGFASEHYGTELYQSNI